MPKIKIPEMEVNTEDFGFPPSASPTVEEVQARIVRLQEQKEFWEKKAKAAQTLTVQRKEDAKKLLEMECDLLLDGAVRDFKISKNEAKFFRQMYLAGNAMHVKEHIESLVAQDYLKRESGIQGDVEGPSDPQIELSVKIAEVVANNPKMSEADAASEVYRRHPGLQDRVLEYRRTHGSGAAKGVGE